MQGSRTWRGWTPAGTVASTDCRASPAQKAKALQKLLQPRPEQESGTRNTSYRLSGRHSDSFQSLVQILGSPLNDWATLSKALKLCKSCFPVCKWGKDTSLCVAGRIKDAYAAQHVHTVDIQQSVIISYHCDYPQSGIINITQYYNWNIYSLYSNKLFQSRFSNALSICLGRRKQLPVYVLLCLSEALHNVIWGKSITQDTVLPIILF